MFCLNFFHFSEREHVKKNNLVLPSYWNIDTVNNSKVAACLYSLWGNDACGQLQGLDWSKPCWHIYGFHCVFGSKVLKTADILTMTVNEWRTDDTWAQRLVCMVFFFLFSMVKMEKRARQTSLTSVGSHSSKLLYSRSSESGLSIKRPHPRFIIKVHQHPTSTAVMSACCVWCRMWLLKESLV